MNVYHLPRYESTPVLYSQNPNKTVDWLLKYDSHLVMEPGELADYARGSIFLLNSEAKVTILEPDTSLKLYYGDSAFLFFEPTVSEMLGKGNNDFGFVKVRIVSPKVTLPI